MTDHYYKPLPRVERCESYENPEPADWDCPDIDIDNDGPLMDDGAEPAVERFARESLLLLLLLI